MKIIDLLLSQWKSISDPSKPAGGRKNLYFTVGAIFATTLILGYLVFSKWDVLISYPWEIDVKFLCLAFFIYTVILLLNVFVWSSIMNRLGQKMSFNKHFRSITISALGKRLPGTLWYVAWRMQLYRGNYSLKLITVASGIEMGVTVVSAVIVCIIFSIPLIIEFSWSIYGIIVMLTVSAIMIHPRFIKWVFKRLKIEANNLKYSDLIIWIGLYLIIWILVGSLLYSFSNFYSPISINHLSFFIGSVALIGVLSRLLLFSPSLFGFGEVSLSLLLSRIVPSPLAVVIAVSNRIFTISFEIIWAVFSLLIEKRK